MTVDNLAVNRVIVAEQTAHGFHIALFQLFPCPGAADLAAVFLCFFDDLGFKTKGRAHFFQHFGCAASLVAKTEILSHNNFFRVQLIHQNLFDKGFRRHVHHFIHKRAFHKAVRRIRSICPRWRPSNFPRVTTLSPLLSKSSVFVRYLMFSPEIT